MLFQMQPESLTIPYWRCQRPSLYVHSSSASEPNHEGKCLLALTGWIRQQPLSVNQIVTLPGFDDYRIHQITILDLEGNAKDKNIQGDPETIFPDPNLQHDLEKENPFVPEEEMQPADEPFTDAVEQTVRHVPKGTSEYQAAWIPDEASVTDTDAEDRSQIMTTESISEIEDIDEFRDAKSNQRGSNLTQLAFFYLSFRKYDCGFG